MAGPAWGQKSCYFPFNFSVDILTSPAIFSFACSLKLSRILKKRNGTSVRREGVNLEKREEAHFMALFSEKYKPTHSSPFLLLSKREPTLGAWLGIHANRLIGYEKKNVFSSILDS